MATTGSPTSTARVAQRQRLGVQLLGLDPQDRQVGREVEADQLRGQHPVVGDAQPELRCTLHDVGVGARSNGGAAGRSAACPESPTP